MVVGSLAKWWALVTICVSSSTHAQTLFGEAAPLNTAQSGDADKPAIVLDSARRKRLIDELRVVAKLSDILEFCNFDEAATLKLFKPDGMVGLNGRTNSSQELEKMQNFTAEVGRFFDMDSNTIHSKLQQLARARERMRMQGHLSGHKEARLKKDDTADAVGPAMAKLKEKLAQNSLRPVTGHSVFCGKHMAASCKQCVLGHRDGVPHKNCGGVCEWAQSTMQCAMKGTPVMTVRDKDTRSFWPEASVGMRTCLLYTSDAADE